MSLMIRLGRRSTLLSLIETAVFFCAVTPLYFVAAALLHVVLASWAGAIALERFGDVGAWFGAMPVWAWIVASLGYVAMVTLYWTPGDAEQDRAEVRALTLLFVLVLVVGGTVLQARGGCLTALVRDFWAVLTTAPS